MATGKAAFSRQCRCFTDSLTCDRPAETDANYESGKQQLNQHSNRYPGHTVLKIPIICQCLGVHTLTTNKCVSQGFL